MLIENVNSLAATIMSGTRQKRKNWLSERFVEQNNPSIELNQFLTDSQDILFKMEQMFFRTTGNRNAMMEPATEMLQQLIDRCNLSLERLKISPPEDANESA